MTTNHAKLRQLFLESFLLDPSEYRTDLRRSELETWDSLGVVALAVGIEETFGVHLTPEETAAIGGVPDVIALLEGRGVAFGD